MLLTTATTIVSWLITTIRVTVQTARTVPINGATAAGTVPTDMVSAATLGTNGVTAAPTVQTTMATAAGKERIGTETAAGMEDPTMVHAVLMESITGATVYKTPQTAPTEPISMETAASSVLTDMVSAATLGTDTVTAAPTALTARDHAAGQEETGTETAA